MLASDQAPALPAPTPRLRAILLAVALLALAVRLLPEPRTIDDAFITFRYSRNIVEGHGFVYNPGVRTLGTTTPLYTLLMAGIGAITGSDQYPWFAVIVNALADACTAALLARIAYRVTEHLPPAALVGLLWALSPMSVTFAVGGMETSVVILWSVAAAYAYLVGRDRGMALCAALGILTRIDAVIWAGPLLLHHAVMTLVVRHRAGITGRRLFPWKTWGVFGAVVLPWFVFSLLYFGTPLSRSLSAKQVAYVVEEFQALTRLLQHLATPFFDSDALGVPGIVIGLLLYPELAAAGTLHAVRREPRLLPLLIYPWLYVILFSLMNPLIFRWYLAPLLPAYVLAIVLGLFVVARALAAALHRPRAALVLVGAVGALWTGFSLNAWTLHPDHGPDRPAPQMAWHEIELDYRQMAELLRRDYGVTSSTLVAAGDIGAVGYYSRARILDTVGLITPEVSHYYPLDRALLIPGANYAVPPAIIEDYRPDYIVFMEMFVRNGLARDPAFTDLYREIAFLPTDFYGTGMLVYQRRDLAARPVEPPEAP